MLLFKDKTYRGDVKRFEDKKFDGCFFDILDIIFKDCILVDCVIFCKNSARFEQCVGNVRYISAHILIIEDSELLLNTHELG